MTAGQLDHRVRQPEPSGHFRRAGTRVAAALDAVLCAAIRPVAGAFPGLARAHDSVIIKHRMRQSLGYRPDLRNPSTYNEKLGWRILHGATPLIRRTTDKVAVRGYVAEKGHADLLIPLLGVYEDVREIVWDDLPDSFVLKASHGCEMNIIVRDKSAVDRDAVLAEAGSWLRQDYYESSREWAYRGIPRRLLVEKLLLGADGKVPADFKFLVFHGRTAAVRVHLDRFGDHTVTFFGRDLEPLPVRQRYPVNVDYVPPPEVAGMVDIAEGLAADFDYARVDLYLVDGRVWFGEITHHDGNAQVWFQPVDFDRRLGELWHQDRSR
ncbi:ATP-grasp fold amidoligase family protein [Nakamurella endophytica]|uniref:Glycosyl transferase n=1 Tax=Nakamurella endophytica TaxID=1748367 RepID=A0A917WBG0_9ACTN|nr:ATP-grasp fold amidoligase family protein [Nakamurella endophytica]GGL91369.1 hypothetical protein GCM10011594_08900 [Nakamurella endophytica]